MPAANLHLTLVFLGNVRADLLPALTQMAGAVHGAAVDLALDTVALWRHNHIVWIGAQVCPEGLREVVAQLAAGARGLAIRTEARDFVPHMSLLRRAQRAPVGFSFPAVEWRAAEFALIRSAPRPGGVAYEVIARWPLAASRH